MAQLNLDRRGFLRFMGAGAASIFLPGCAANRNPQVLKAPADKPNIVFFLVDDLGWTDLGCYGSSFYKTPNIDKLAAQGMKFTDAYAACPVCSPTRASILTGKYPARLNLTNHLGGKWGPEDSPIKPAVFEDKLPAKEVTIAEALKSAGYTSAMIGKWHLGGDRDWPYEQGFDVVNTNPSQFGRSDKYKGEDDYFTDILTDKAIDFLEINGDKPFFLYLSHYSVHIPIASKESKIAKYKARLSKKPPGKCEHDNPYYAAMIESVDESLGRVMQKLQTLGIEDRTVVVFFSDNGGLATDYGQGERLRQLGIEHWAKYTPATKNTPLREGKGYLYEGGIRESCIVKWPHVTKPGTVCKEPVISNDFLPTFCEMAGLDKSIPETNGPIDGLSIVGLLKNANSNLQRESLFWHYPHFSNEGGRPGGAVRCGKWKLIERYENGELELYDLENDISETTNLAYIIPDKAKELRNVLSDWRKQVGANMPLINPDYLPTGPVIEP